MSFLVIAVSAFADNFFCVFIATAKTQSGVVPLHLADNEIVIISMFSARANVSSFRTTQGKSFFGMFIICQNSPLLLHCGNQRLYESLLSPHQTNSKMQTTDLALDTENSVFPYNACQNKKMRFTELIFSKSCIF